MKNKQLYTICSVVILLLAAFIFVLLPAMVGRGAGNKLPSFGSYNGKDILYKPDTDFTNAAAQYEEFAKFQAQYQGQEYRPDYFSIFSYAFNATVMKMAYTDYVKKSGWKPAKEAIKRSLVVQREFLDENGNFSQRRYNQTSDEIKLKMQGQIEAALTASRYAEDMFGSEDNVVGKDALYGLKTPDSEVAFLKNFAGKERSFDMAAFDTSSYPDSEAQSYGKAHSELFVSYDMSVISMDDKSEAEKVLSRLTKNDGITFKDAVSEYSKKNYSGDDGRLNNKFGYQLKSIIKDESDYQKVIGMKMGDTSDVIQVSTGYALFHADGNAVQPDFEESSVIETVHSYMKTYEAGRIEDYFIAVANDFASNAVSSGFDSACKTMNTEKIAVPSFPLNYNNVSIANSVPSLQELPNAASNENFLKTAFSLSQEQLSEPVVVGRYVVVLKMTGESENTVAEENAQEKITEAVKLYDKNAASAELFASPKVKNNVFSVVLQYFLGDGSK